MFPSPTLGSGVGVVCPDPLCASDDIVEDRRAGTAVCRECGIVAEENLLDVTSEWRTFQDDVGGSGADPVRVGLASNPLLDSPALTDIQVGHGSKSLRRTQNKFTTSKADKLMIDVFGRLDEICVRMSLPVKAVGDRAKEYFKRFIDVLGCTGGQPGKARAAPRIPVDEILSASLLFACRKAGCPRSLLEITAVTRVPPRKIGRVCRDMEDVLPELRCSRSETAVDHIARFAYRLRLPREIICEAERCAKMAGELDASGGKRPTTIAAATLFLVCNNAKSDLKRTLKTISEVSGVGEGTIRSTWKLLLPHFAEAMSHDISFQSFNPAAVCANQTMAKNLAFSKITKPARRNRGDSDREALLLKK